MKRPVASFPYRLGFWAALLAGAALFGGALPAWAPAGNEDSPAPGRPQVRLAENYGRLPLHFIENRGQVDDRVQFYAKGRGYGIYFTREGVVFSLRRAEAREPGPAAQEAAEPSGPAWPARLMEALGLGRLLPPVPVAGKGADRLVPDRVRERRSRHPVPGAGQVEPREAGPPAVVTMTPVGLGKNARLAARAPLPGQVNYFLGSDPKKWRTGIPTYEAVVLEDAYPGVDLKFYGRGRQLEYDVVVQPGADPGQVRFAYEGVKELRLTAAGDLALMLPDGGELIQHKPYVYQEIAGQRVAREGKFRLVGDGARLSCGFQVAAYDNSRPLIIDPVLAWSTYLGGSDIDRGRGIAADPGGNAYVTGSTRSDDFPTLNPVQGARKGGTDAFVAKLTPAGALAWSTYLGGSDADGGEGIAVDPGGNAYFTGYTDSDDFPTLNPVQGARKGGSDAFVAKLTPAGALAWSTYLGGSSGDGGLGIAADPGGNAYVTGPTNSDDFPRLNPVQGARKGEFDAFVTKLTPAGALSWSTYLGGSGDDVGRGIAADPGGNAYVTGYTYSADFPFPVQGAIKGAYDAFVTKLTPAGALAWSTYLGGSGGDAGCGIAADPGGNAYVTGGTYSDDFPTLNPVQGARKGGGDAFVTKLTPAGALAWSTYLGGSFYDEGHCIAADPGGNAYVTGETNSDNFPRLNPIQGARKGVDDAFVTKFTPAGALAWSTYLGGSDYDEGCGIAADPGGNAYVTGYTSSDDFPCLNPVQGARKGQIDAFVTKLSADGLDALSITPPSGMQTTKFAIAGGGAAPASSVVLYRKALKTAKVLTHYLKSTATGRFSFNWYTSKYTVPGEYEVWAKDVKSGKLTPTKKLTIYSNPKVYLRLKNRLGEDCIYFTPTNKVIVPRFATDAAYLTDPTLVNVYMGFQLPSGKMLYDNGTALTTIKAPLWANYEVQDIIQYITRAELRYRFTSAAVTGAYSFWCYFEEVNSGNLVGFYESLCSYHAEADSGNPAPDQEAVESLSAAKPLEAPDNLPAGPPAPPAPEKRRMAAMPEVAQSSFNQGISPLQAYKTAVGGWKPVTWATFDIFAQEYLSDYGYNIFRKISQIKTCFTYLVDGFKIINPYLSPEYNNYSDEERDLLVMVNLLEWFYMQGGIIKGVDISDEFRTCLDLMTDYWTQLQDCGLDKTFWVKAQVDKPWYYFWAEKRNVKVDIYQLVDIQCDCDTHECTFAPIKDLARLQTPIRSFTLTTGWPNIKQVDVPNYGIYRAVTTDLTNNKKYYRLFTLSNEHLHPTVKVQVAY